MVEVESNAQDEYRSGIKDVSRSFSFAEVIGAVVFEDAVDGAELFEQHRSVIAVTYMFA